MDSEPKELPPSPNLGSNAPQAEMTPGDNKDMSYQRLEDSESSIGTALWILLAMAISIILGNFVPNTGPALQRGKLVGVSVPIAVGLLVMMYPILCKICFSIFVNWILAPFLMLALA
ncbi:MAG: arsenical-resistance [Lasallia pustulata]|uniref:Arsenical-resistance n=1 Tax=Lasallia pustulata TaxID=136370 RepID=A0A5M8PB18_9LECA|nr:MAG: arsenical-resistance [Lasallia pustulata]